MYASRAWMYNRVEGGFTRLEFVIGVRAFINFVRKHCTTFLHEQNTRCPCRKCGNEKYFDLETVELHLMNYGFVPDYYCWTKHGEEEGLLLLKEQLVQQQLFLQQLSLQQYPRQSQFFQQYPYLPPLQRPPKRAPFFQTPVSSHVHSHLSTFMSFPSLFGLYDLATLQAYSTLFALQLRSPITGHVTSKGSAHASPSHQQDHQHIPITPFHSGLYASPSTSHHVEHASHSPSTLGHHLSDLSINSAPHGQRRGNQAITVPRGKGNAAQDRGRIFLFVLEEEPFKLSLQPMLEASRKMTRAYKNDLHKDGYCWETVPDHIKEQYWIRWKGHFNWDQLDDVIIRLLYDRHIATHYSDFISKMVKKPTKPDYISLEIFEHYKKMQSTPDYKAKSNQTSQNQRTEVGGLGVGMAVHASGSISIHRHALRLEKKFGRSPSALELYLYLHNKDHDCVTFLDSRAETIVTAICNRRLELAQLHGPDTPIDEIELYLSVVEHNDKGQRFGLGWTPSGIDEVYT
ncbi:hypothetical protein Sjap_008851 [Stephania japonica]|uniref:Transposase-associated domain-containing protein n=1 Tax=Stephania japonica TaxID=461633 RepID=A0AAP0JSR9_9MAGN